VEERKAASSAPIDAAPPVSESTALIAYGDCWAESGAVNSVVTASIAMMNRVQAMDGPSKRRGFDGIFQPTSDSPQGNFRR
jgi:hypothetical protein